MSSSFTRSISTPDAKMKLAFMNQNGTKTRSGSSHSKKTNSMVSNQSCDDHTLRTVAAQIPHQVYYSSTYQDPSRDGNGPSEFSKSHKHSAKSRKCSYSRHSPEDLKKLTETFYAGAKFSNHPHPSQLPRPPQRWLTNCRSSEKNNELALEKERCLAMSNELKILLKVNN